jgi:hypothetical protein
MNVGAAETPAARSRNCGSVLRNEFRGYASLEELPTLWGENNPCLIMVMRL